MGVYAFGPDERKRQPPSFGEFRRSLGDILADEVAKPWRGYQVALAKPNMETLVAERMVPLGAARAVVGCVGQYVIMRPQSQL